MRIFLTGAAGLSGRVLLARLLEDGHEVVAPVRGSGGLGGLGDDPGCRMLKRDILDIEALPEGIGAVIHAAATSPVPGVGAGRLTRDNVEATRHLVDLARNAGVGGFVLFSSVSVFGRIDVPLVDEDTPLTDPCAYGVTKRLGEMLVEETASEGAFRALALRLPAVVGKSASRNWPSQLVARARRGENLAIYNPDASFNNAIHVDDLAAFVAGLLDRQWKGFDAVTLGGGGTMTIRELAEAVAARSGVRVSVEAASRSSFLISNARAQARFGYRPAPVRSIVERYLDAEFS